MTWLDEIKLRILDYINTIGEGDVLLHSGQAAVDDLERMARVIRELVGHIEDVKAWAEHAGMYLVDGMAGDDPVLARLCKEAFESWNNLSPDAKEIMESEK